MATATKEATDKTPRVYTEYVVYQFDGEGYANEIGKARGLNDLKAIQALAVEKDLKEGEFLAVPVRSHKRRKVAVEVKSRIAVR